MRPVSCDWLGRGGGGVTEEGRIIPGPVIVTRGQGLGGGRGLVRHLSLFFSHFPSRRRFVFFLFTWRKKDFVDKLESRQKHLKECSFCSCVQLKFMKQFPTFHMSHQAAPTRRMTRVKETRMVRMAITAS